jgi:hypothetical protein
MREELLVQLRHFPVCSGAWLALAIVVSMAGFSFGIYWQKGVVSLTTIAIILRMALVLLFFGWIAPAALGLWLPFKPR